VERKGERQLTFLMRLAREDGARIFPVNDLIDANKAREVVCLCAL